MGAGDVEELVLALGEGDVEAGVALGDSVKEELQAKRGLAGARLAFDQVDPVGGIAAAKDVIEWVGPRRDRAPVVRENRLRCHSNPPRGAGLCLKRRTEAIGYEAAMRPAVYRL